MKTKLIYFLLLFSSVSFGQIEQYNFKNEIIGISDPWHQLVLPNEMFKNVSEDLNDVRVYGITPNSDTIEAPYVLVLKEDQLSNTSVAFKIINRSSNESGQFFTFQIDEESSINQIKLNFAEQNFDWLARLEGSQDQKEWFTIVDEHRLVSIKNAWTDYKFTKINFPSSKYKYFRIRLNNVAGATLQSAEIVSQNVVKGVYKNYPVHSFKTEEDKKRKTTVLKIALEEPVPVSYLKIEVENEFDYYRSMAIQYLADSVKTEVGWNYIYRNLSSGTLNSIDNNEMQFTTKTIQNLRIIIQNQDNQPLTINQVILKGIEHQLIVRFTNEANYFLVYGNSKVRKPRYDIARFMDKIPKDLIPLTLGSSFKIGTEKEEIEQKPLFQNKFWLYGIMIFIIGLLGWFSLKMLKE